MGVWACFEFANEAAKTHQINWDKAINKDSLDEYFEIEREEDDYDEEANVVEEVKSAGGEKPEEKPADEVQQPKQTRPTTYEDFAKNCWPLQ